MKKVVFIGIVSIFLSSCALAPLGHKQQGMTCIGGGRPSIWNRAFKGEAHLFMMEYPKELTPPTKFEISEHLLSQDGIALSWHCVKPGTHTFIVYALGKIHSASEKIVVNLEQNRTYRVYAYSVPSAFKFEINDVTTKPNKLVYQFVVSSDTEWDQDRPALDLTGSMRQ